MIVQYFSWITAIANCIGFSPDLKFLSLEESQDSMFHSSLLFYENVSLFIWKV